MEGGWQGGGVGHSPPIFFFFFQNFKKSFIEIVYIPTNQKSFTAINRLTLSQDLERPTIIFKKISLCYLRTRRRIESLIFSKT